MNKRGLSLIVIIAAEALLPSANRWQLNNPRTLLNAGRGGFAGGIGGLAQDGSLYLMQTLLRCR